MTKLFIPTAHHLYLRIAWRWVFFKVTFVHSENIMTATYILHLFSASSVAEWVMRKPTTERCRLPLTALCWTLLQGEESSESKESSVFCLGLCTSCDLHKPDVPELHGPCFPHETAWKYHSSHKRYSQWQSWRRLSFKMALVHQTRQGLPYCRN